MDVLRWKYLESAEGGQLTPTETAEGWHFCNSEWDGMLIHKNWEEFEACTCQLTESLEGKTNAA